MDEARLCTWVPVELGALSSLPPPPPPKYFGTLSFFLTIELLLSCDYVLQQYGLLKVKKRTRFLTGIGVPERKILIGLGYYVVLTVFVLTSFTLSVRNIEPFATELRGHFACEQLGQDPENPMLCDRQRFRRLAYPEVTAVGFVLLGLFPVVNLVYVLNVKELKEKWKVCCKTE